MLAVELYLGGLPKHQNSPLRCRLHHMKNDVGLLAGLKSMSDSDGIILNPSTFKPRLRSTIRSVVFILRYDGSEMIRMFDCQIGSDSAKTAEF